MSMKLSEAILAGCKIAPKKSCGRFLDATDLSVCLLGAAALGSGMTFDQIKECNKVRLHLSKQWPDLIRDGGFEYALIVHDAVIKNNLTGATREEIAANLAAQGY